MPPINMLEVDKASKMAHTSPSDKPVNHLEELGNVVIRRNRVRRSNCIRMDKHSSRVRVSTLTRSWLLKEGTDFSLPADGGEIPLDPEPVSPPAAPPMGSVPKASQLRGGRESRSESFNSEEENCYADNLIDSVEESCYADNIIDSIDNGSVSHTDSVEEYFNYEELDEVLGPKNGSLADSECCSLSSEASNESLTSSMSTCQIQRTVSQNWQKKHLKRATRAVGTHWPFKGTLTNNQITSFLSQSSSQLKELKISQERMQKITEVFRRPLTSIQNSKLKEKFRRRSEVPDNQSDAMRRVCDMFAGRNQDVLNHEPDSFTDDDDGGWSDEFDDDSDMDDCEYINEPQQLVNDSCDIENYLDPAEVNGKYPADGMSLPRGSQPGPPLPPRNNSQGSLPELPPARSNVNVPPRQPPRHEIPQVPSRTRPFGQQQVPPPTMPRPAHTMAPPSRRFNDDDDDDDEDQEDYIIPESNMRPEIPEADSSSDSDGYEEFPEDEEGTPGLRPPQRLPPRESPKPGPTPSPAARRGLPQLPGKPCPLPPGGAAGPAPPLKGPGIDLTAIQNGRQNMRKVSDERPGFHVPKHKPRESPAPGPKPREPPAPAKETAPPQNGVASMIEKMNRTVALKPPTQPKPTPPRNKPTPPVKPGQKPAPGGPPVTDKPIPQLPKTPKPIPVLPDRNGPSPAARKPREQPQETSPRDPGPQMLPREAQPVPPRREAPGAPGGHSARPPTRPSKDRPPLPLPSREGRSGSPHVVAAVQKRALPKPPPEAEHENLYEFEWFAGSIETSLAVGKLRGIGENGTFMVRRSMNGLGNPFTLIVLCSGHIFKLPIRRRGDNKFALGTQKDNETTFRTVQELINYHKDRTIRLSSAKGGYNGETVLRNTPTLDR